MSSFTDALIYQSTPDFAGSARIYRVVTAFSYWVGDVGSSLRIDVPADFLTDLASVPRLMRWLFSPDGRWAQAAVVHDLLYQECKIPRATCDAILREAILVCECSRATAWTVWMGVRLGGWVPYRRYGRGGA